MELCLNEVLSGLKISQLVCGYNHSLCLTENGKIYAWGNNQHGQLGFGDTVNRYVPESIPFFQKSSKSVKRIVSGQFHNVVLCENGTYVWGRNDFGQLGVGTTKDQFHPIPFNALESIDKLECGSDHIIAQTKDGSLYSWGFGEFGQLGIGNFENQHSPKQLVITLSQTENQTEKIASIHCYGNHSAILTSLSRCYLWGSNQRGELSSQIQHPEIPTLLTDPNKPIRWIGGGFYHTVLVTADFEVYTCGWNYYGELGVGDKKPRNQFTLVKFPSNPEVSLPEEPTVVVNLNEMSFNKDNNNNFQSNVQTKLKKKKKKKRTPNENKEDEGESSSNQKK